MFGGPINGLQADVLPADENGAPLAPSRDINLIGLAWVLPGVLEPLVLAHMYSLFASPYRVFFLASAALMVLQVGLLLILSLCDLWLTLVALSRCFSLVSVLSTAADVAWCAIAYGTRFIHL